MIKVSIWSVWGHRVQGTEHISTELEGARAWCGRSSPCVCVCASVCVVPRVSATCVVQRVCCTACECNVCRCVWCVCVFVCECNVCRCVCVCTRSTQKGCVVYVCLCGLWRVRKFSHRHTQCTHRVSRGSRVVPEQTPTAPGLVQP